MWVHLHFSVCVCVCRSEEDAQLNTLLILYLILGVKVLHRTWSLPVLLVLLSSGLQESTCLCAPPVLGLLYLAVYMGTDDLNSGLRLVWLVLYLINHLSSLWFGYFETESQSVCQTGLELMPIFLCGPPVCCPYRCEPLSSATVCFIWLPSGPIWRRE